MHEYIIYAYLMFTTMFLLMFGKKAMFYPKIMAPLKRIIALYFNLHIHKRDTWKASRKTVYHNVFLVVFLKNSNLLSKYL